MVGGMAIIPDDKNWTWVLERPCPECGFVTDDWPADEIGARIRANAAAWPALLADPRARVRPDDAHWSALEYGCHVRDVFRLGQYRLGLMLDQDAPRFANWDQDVTAIEDRYGEQDPRSVIAEIEAAAVAFAERYDAVSGADWQRTGLRSDGAAFTVESFARYLIHDPVHHVWDVQQGYDRLAAADV